MVVKKELSFFDQVKAKAIRWLEDNRGLVIVLFCLPASFVGLDSLIRHIYFTVFFSFLTLLSNSVDGFVALSFLPLRTIRKESRRSRKLFNNGTNFHQIRES